MSIVDVNKNYIKVLRESSSMIPLVKNKNFKQLVEILKLTAV